MSRYIVFYNCFTWNSTNETMQCKPRGIPSQIIWITMECLNQYLIITCTSLNLHFGSCFLHIMVFLKECTCPQMGTLILWRAAHKTDRNVYKRRASLRSHTVLSYLGFLDKRGICTYNHPEYLKSHSKCFTGRTAICSDTLSGEHGHG